MARAKKVNSIAKCKTPKKCRTSRKKTNAVMTKPEIVNDIPEELLPKENKWKKAAKVLLGLATAGSAAAMGYYGYKNKDKLSKEFQEAIKNGKAVASEKYTDAKKFATENWKKSKDYVAKTIDDTKKSAKENYKKGKEYLEDKYIDGVMKLNDLQDDINKRGVSKVVSSYFKSQMKKRKQNNSTKTYEATNTRRSKKMNNLINSMNFPDNDLGPLAITDGSEKYKRPEPKKMSDGWSRPYREPNTSLGLVSDNWNAPLQEINVTGALENILSKLKKSNSCDYDNLYNIITEYKRQTLSHDPFARSLIDGPIFDALDDCKYLNDATSDTAIDSARDKLERSIDTLISLYFDIMRK